MRGVEWGAMLPNEAFAAFFVALTREIRVYDSGLIENGNVCGFWT